MTYYSKLKTTLDTATDAAMTSPRWHMEATKEFGLTTNTVKSATYQCAGTGEIGVVTGPLTGALVENTQAILIENKSPTGFIWVRSFVTFGEYTPATYAEKVTVTRIGPFASPATNYLFTLRWGDEHLGNMTQGKDMKALGAMTGGVILVKDAPSPNEHLSGLSFPILEVYTDTTSVTIQNNALVCSCKASNLPVAALDQDITVQVGAMLQQKVEAGDQLQITGDLMQTRGGFNVSVPVSDQMPISIHGDGTNAVTVDVMVIGA